MSGGTGYEQVRNLGQIYHENLIGNRLTKSDRKLHLSLLKFFGVEDTFHTHDIGLGIWYFDTDGSLARNRSDDTDTQSCKTQGDIIFQILDLGDAHTFSWLDFVERNRRTYRSSDGLDLHTEIAQNLNDSVLVGYLFLFVNISTVVLIFLQQVERRVLISGERFFRVDRRIQLYGAAHGVAGSLFLVGSYGNIHADMLGSEFGSFLFISFSLRSLVAQSALVFQE